MLSPAMVRSMTVRISSAEAVLYQKLSTPAALARSMKLHSGWLVIMMILMLGNRLLIFSAASRPLTFMAVQTSIRIRSICWVIQ